MRSINDDKGSFTTKGNTNGVYNNMEREAGHVSKKSMEAKARFERKPWFVTAAEQLRELQKKK